MSKRTKAWLVISIVLTVYLVYMVGIAAVLTHGFEDNFILNFLNHPDNANSTARVIDWVALLSIIMWIVWGVSFIKDERKAFSGLCRLGAAFL